MEATNSAIIALLDQTATSLGNSFANYWPADDKNDPVERNVSFHFAHALMSAGFSVFAEADHPNRKNVQGIDLLGIAPGNSWFLAAEFKRLYNAEKVESMSNDIDRLLSFWLRTEFSSEEYGNQQEQVATNCKLGYGLVGGLHWVSGKKESSNILDIWLRPSQLSPGSVYAEVAEKLASLNAVLPEPNVVHTFPTGNRYYLLAAFFQIKQ